MVAMRNPGCALRIGDVVNVPDALRLGVALDVSRCYIWIQGEELKTLVRYVSIVDRFEVVKQLLGETRAFGASADLCVAVDPDFIRTCIWCSASPPRASNHMVFETAARSPGPYARQSQSAPRSTRLYARQIFAALRFPGQYDLALEDAPRGGALEDGSDEWRNTMK